MATIIKNPKNASIAFKKLNSFKSPVIMCTNIIIGAAGIASHQNLNTYPQTASKNVILFIADLITIKIEKTNAISKYTMDE